MAIQFYDCMHHYGTNTARLVAVYGQNANTGSAELDTASSPDGLRTYNCNGNNARLTVPLPNPMPTIWLSAYWLMRSFAAGDGIASLRFYDSNNNVHVRVELDSIGRIVVRRNTTFLGQSEPILIGWHHIGILVTVHDTEGEVRILLDGHEVLHLTEVDTRDAGLAEVGRVSWGVFGNAGLFITPWRLHSWVIGDTTGPAPTNDILPFFGVGFLPVIEDGEYSQFTPNDGTNVSRVNDDIPDGDTTYNESDTPGHKDSFTFAPLPANVESVLAMRAVLDERKVADGASDIRPFFRVNGNDYVAEAVAQLQTYQHRLGSILSTNPDTTDPWEIAEVDAAEVGYEKVV